MLSATTRPLLICCVLQLHRKIDERRAKLRLRRFEHLLAGDAVLEVRADHQDWGHGHEEDRQSVLRDCEQDTGHQERRDERDDGKPLWLWRLRWLGSDQLDTHILRVEARRAVELDGGADVGTRCGLTRLERDRERRVADGGGAARFEYGSVDDLAADQDPIGRTVIDQLHHVGDVDLGVALAHERIAEANVGRSIAADKVGSSP